jgi:uncharacterized protein (TIGR04255 family)
LLASDARAIGGTDILMSDPVRPFDLPDFDNPPVVETVLSVQFTPLAELRTAHLGLLWEQYREAFPRADERPTLERVVEQFPETPRLKLGLELQAYENPPMPRLWFTTALGNEMIQVQSDRFLKNWRKEGEGETYPRYEKNRASFERDFAIFREFVTANGLGELHIDQCEVTYVNHILSGLGWEEFADVDNIFSFWKPPQASIPGQVQDLRSHMRFVIPLEDRTPVGRLHVNVQPAFRASDNAPMYVFHLTARGQIGESFDFLDLGRRWIVKSFAELTTPRMHAIWGRRK